jgi:hypothetical protein
MARTTLRTSLAGLALALAVVLALGANASAQDGTTTSSVMRFSDSGVVEDALSTLIRSDGAVSVVLTTGGLEPLAPYTIWWVVFNEPSGCLGACDEDDLFNPDGTMNINEAADISILFADGALTDGDGRAAFSGVLLVGSPLGEVVYGPGLRDAHAAEIHIVVRSHGPLDTGRALEQLSTFEPHPTIGGDCVLCADQHFAVHLP